jgi:hypothetical protein
MGNRLGYPRAHFAGFLMLPESQHGPTCKFKTGSGLSIALDSSLQFRRPVGNIRLRNTSMYGTGVPEAAIHENGELEPGKGDIHQDRTPFASPDRIVRPVAKTTGMEQGSEP